MIKQSISIRLSDDNLKYIDGITKKLNLNRTSVIESMITNCMNDKLKLKRLNVVLEKKSRFKKKKEIAHVLRKNNHDRYILNNSIKNACNMAFMDKCTMSRINMKKINGLIDDVFKLIDCFEDEMKEELKDDINFIKKLRKEEFLEESLKNISFIKKMIEAKK